MDYHLMRREAESASIRLANIFSQERWFSGAGISFDGINIPELFVYYNDIPLTGNITESFDGFRVHAIKFDHAIAYADN